MKRVVTFFCLIFATIAVLPGCGGQGFDRDLYLEKGRTTLIPFKQQLMGALREGLKSGPGAAIEVCSRQAPEIAAAIGSETVTVGRASHRVRNPRNAPSAWMEPLIEDYAADPQRTGPEVVRIDDQHIGYVEPIHVKPLCLACHGTAIDPDTAERIHDAYPADAATGFAAGDFRGVFWVAFTEE